MNLSINQATPCYRAEIPLELPTSADFIYFARNSMGFGDVPPLVGAWFKESEFASEDVVVVGDEKTNVYVLAGALTANRSLTFLKVILRGGRFHSIEVKQPDIIEGDEPEEMVLLQGDDWRELLTEYANLVSKATGADAIGKPDETITGYCSWYYYFEKVTEKDFRDNITAIKNRKDCGFLPEIIQIDDGYQRFHGDWLDRNDGWPSPLMDTARLIAMDAHQAGIWLMPFVAATNSDLYKRHPDWFVKNQDGTPSVSEGWSDAPNNIWACLDMTISEVRKHIADIFITMREWGFIYFKMDGLSYGLMPGQRSDSTATPVCAFRLGLRTIREAVPDATLLACSGPIMPCLGLVDMCRVGADTYASTPRIEHSFHELSGRWWMFDRFFRADPDVVIAREDHAEQSIGASRISALTAVITGMAFTSDHLGLISDERLALLKRAAETRLTNVVPLRWKKNDWLRCFFGEIAGQQAVALFNDTDDIMCYELIDLGFEHMATEILHPMGRINHKLTLNPHDAALLID